MFLQGIISENRAVSPVIATVILISATLVLALVVGSYTFGLFGSNAKTTTISSIILYGGTTASPNQNAPTASLTISVDNLGSATTISSLSLTGTGIDAITQWLADSNGTTSQVIFSNSYQTGGINAVRQGAVSKFTFYPLSNSSQIILTGETLDFVVNFANGESVSGALIGQ